MGSNVIGTRFTTTPHIVAHKRIYQRLDALPIIHRDMSAAVCSYIFSLSLSSYEQHLTFYTSPQGAKKTTLSCTGIKGRIICHVKGGEMCQHQKVDTLAIKNL